MKRLLQIFAGTLTIALLAFPPQASAVPGLNFAWDECRGNGGLALKTFACDVSTTAFIANAVGSIVAPAGLVALNSAEVTIDITIDDTSVPPWWDFGVAPACRPPNAISLDYLNPLVATCLDYFNQFANPPSGGQSYQNPGLGGANHTQLDGVLAVDATTTAAIAAGTEVLVFTLRLRASSTSTCTGCLTAASLWFNDATLAQSGGNPGVVIDAPAATGSDCAKWQTLVVECGSKTPVQNRTWGEVKSLYR